MKTVDLNYLGIRAALNSHHNLKRENVRVRSCEQQHLQILDVDDPIIPCFSIMLQNISLLRNRLLLWSYGRLLTQFYRFPIRLKLGKVYVYIAWISTSFQRSFFLFENMKINRAFITQVRMVIASVKLGVIPWLPLDNEFSSELVWTVRQQSKLI